jgi:hypothetical protein
MFENFSYTSTNLVEHSTIAIPAPAAANAPQACCICGHQVAGHDRQNHMGGHILRRLRDVEESFENIGSMVLHALLSNFGIYVIISLILTFIRFQYSIRADSAPNQV